MSDASTTDLVARLRDGAAVHGRGSHPRSLDGRTSKLFAAAADRIEALEQQVAELAAAKRSLALENLALLDRDLVGEERAIAERKPDNG